MEGYEMQLVIEELLRTIARLKSEGSGKDFEISCLQEDVKSLRNEVARLEAVVAEKETAKAS